MMHYSLYFVRKISLLLGKTYNIIVKLFEFKYEHRARDLDDHVDWLLAAQRYEAALLAVDESCMRRHSIANVGAQVSSIHLPFLLVFKSLFLPLVCFSL